MTLLIRTGDRSEQVADVQARLRALGIGVDDEHGYFGRSTKEAVQLFQQRRGLIADGIVGPNTWDELVEAGWRLGDRSLYLKNPMMRGDDVKALQARLNALGFNAGREDGIFGHDTYVAVREFQKEYAIPEDGIFGPDTHAALIGLRVERPGTAAHLREELRRAERSRLRDATVVLDAGHGGEDRGVTAGDARKARLCWSIAVATAERLVGAGARVRLGHTQTEDVDVATIARRANEADADVLISIHLNVHQEPTAEGASSYYFAGSRAGAALAGCLQDEMVKLGLKDCRSHGRHYALLKETRMPAVIVEPGFVTNPDEAKRLEDPAFIASLADAILAALRRYFEEQPD